MMRRLILIFLSSLLVSGMLSGELGSAYGEAIDDMCECLGGHINEQTAFLTAGGQFTSADWKKIQESFEKKVTRLGKKLVFCPRITSTHHLL
jgi:hypothetical protein